MGSPCVGSNPTGVVLSKEAFHTSKLMGFLQRDWQELESPMKDEMTPAGLEPAIPGSVGRCLIHWTTGPDDHTVNQRRGARQSNASASFLFFTVRNPTSGVAQWLACWAHNPKVRGSKPRSATFMALMGCLRNVAACAVSSLCCFPFATLQLARAHL